MVEERSKRRLATILASDVVGFSRLMEADEDSGLCELKFVLDEIFSNDSRTLPGPRPLSLQSARHEPLRAVHMLNAMLIKAKLQLQKYLSFYQREKFDPRNVIYCLLKG